MAALDIYTPTKQKIDPNGIPGMDEDAPISDSPTIASLQKERLANRAAQQAAAIQQQQLQDARDKQGMTFASQAEAEKAGYNPEGAAVLPEGRGIRIPKVVGRENKNVGQQEVDKKYADDFVQWETGGASDAIKSRAQLKAVQEQLKSGKNLTGPVIGSMPDSVLAFTNKEAIETRQAVEEVVQRNLKAVLGGAFTQKEGDALIARAFNPRLSEEQNSARLARLLKQIELASDAKAAAADYYRAYGTLRGWKGRMPRLSDFDPENDATPGTGTTPAQPPAKKTGKEIIERNGKRYEVDHDTKAVREI